MEQIYSWSRLTPLDRVKVVILGQVRYSDARLLELQTYGELRTPIMMLAKRMVSHWNVGAKINFIDTSRLGLSFSVLPPTKVPGSLKNIYKQLCQDIPGFTTPTSGCVKHTPSNQRNGEPIPILRSDLSRVAELGVLWLNTSLTVRAHKAGSHAKKGWETFTAEVLRKVLARQDHPGVVFMAWGLPAQKTCDSIGVDEVSRSSLDY